MSPGMVVLVVLGSIAGLILLIFAIWFDYWLICCVMDYRRRVKHGLRYHDWRSNPARARSEASFSSKLSEYAAQKKAEEENKNQGN